MVIDVDAAAPAYLVLADSHAPGWTATVDGVPATIWPADALFRAVRVEPGRRRVTFVYRPTSFRAGLVMGVLGLGLAGTLWGRRRRER